MKKVIEKLLKDSIHELFMDAHNSINRLGIDDTCNHIMETYTDSMLKLFHEAYIGNNKMTQQLQKNTQHNEYSQDNRTILEHANDIIFNREEDKARQYGEFSENMAKCARIASEICMKEITTEDFYKCMIALKVGRMAYNTKYDTLLDACGYIAGLDDFKNKNNK
jgi:hypothetical protein